MKNLYCVRRSLFAFLFFSIGISACQPGNGQSAGDGPGDTPGDATSSGTETDGVEVDLVLGPGPLYLTDPRIGLSDLSSYKALLTIGFVGTEGGQPSEWSRSLVMMHTSEPLIRSLSIENIGESSTADPNFLAEADGAAFEIGEDGTCRVDLINAESSRFDLLEPTEMLSPIFGAEEDGPEVISGITANHFTFDERALLQFGVAETSGDVWVAADGGYIVRYTVTTTAGQEYFGDGIEGTMTWDYALTDINQLQTIEMPAPCLDGLVPAPRLPDATNVVSLPNWLRFDTSVSIEEASAFFQEELPVLGWGLTNAPPIAEMAELAQMTPENLILLEFTQGNQVLYVTITLGLSITEVSIVMSSTGE